MLPFRRLPICLVSDEMNWPDIFAIKDSGKAHRFLEHLIPSNVRDVDYDKIVKHLMSTFGCDRSIIGKLLGQTCLAHNFKCFRALIEQGGDAILDEPLSTWLFLALTRKLKPGLGNDPTHAFLHYVFYKLPNHIKKPNILRRKHWNRFAQACPQSLMLLQTLIDQKQLFIFEDDLSSPEYLVFIQQQTQTLNVYLLPVLSNLVCQYQSFKRRTYFMRVPRMNDILPCSYSRNWWKGYFRLVDYLALDAYIPLPYKPLLKNNISTVDLKSNLPVFQCDSKKDALEICTRQPHFAMYLDLDMSVMQHSHKFHQSCFLVVGGKTYEFLRGIVSLLERIANFQCVFTKYKIQIYYHSRIYLNLENLLKVDIIF